MSTNKCSYYNSFAYFIIIGSFKTCRMFLFLKQIPVQYLYAVFSMIAGDTEYISPHFTNSY